MVCACSGDAPPGDAHTASVEQAETIPPPPTPAAAAVLMAHDDMARTGQQPSESVLTQATVKQDFGKQYMLTVDSRIYAQPLFVPGVMINGAPHDVVYVVTENNTVYAFDANTYSTTPLWPPVNFGHWVPSTDVLPTGCLNIPDRIGITGTPVIDATANKMYFVAATKTGSTYAQTLYAIDIRTGATLDQVAVSAHATNTSGAVNPSFDPKKDNQRAGLLLAGGRVWVSWASHCSDAVSTRTYSGWVMAFNAASLATAPLAIDVGSEDDTSHPNLGNDLMHGGAGVWMGGGGLVSDGTYVWVSTGNGWLDAAHDQLGDSALRLEVATSPTPAIVVDDWFAPYNQDDLYQKDLDMSSTGMVLLPSADFPALGRRPIAAATKSGEVYLLDAYHLGGTQTGSANRICVGAEAGDCALVSTGLILGADSSGYQQKNYSTPAYWNKRLYYVGVEDTLRMYRLDTGPLWPSSYTTGSQGTYGYPGATPSISVNPLDGTAIVWTVDRDGDRGYQTGKLSFLYANSASDLTLLYSTKASYLQQDNPYNPTQFQAPTVAGGHVFIGGSTGAATNVAADDNSIGRLSIYGLELEAPNATVVAGSTTAIPITTKVRDGTNTPKVFTSLAVTGVPAGASVTFSPATLQLSAIAPATATFDAGAAVPGTYLVTWQATNSNTTFKLSTTVTITAALPTAAFMATCSGWRCTFDASTSTGANLSYSWALGNGQTATGGPILAWDYRANGTFSPQLTVSNAAGSASATHSVTVNDPPPIASFTYTCTARACNFNGTASSDVPGPLSQLAWNFGDSHTATGGTVSHTFSTNGTYQVMLTAIDSEGQLGHQTRAVSAVDNRPIAVLSVSCSNWYCTANTAGTTDDYGIATSSINWGDGTVQSGAGVPATAPHTYAANGTYTVALTVVDTGGQATTAVASVPVAWPLTAQYFTEIVAYVHPSSYSFEASASAGAFPITGYHWVWADGTVMDSTSPEVYRLITNPDDSSASPTLTVTDTSGATSTIAAPYTIIRKTQQCCTGGPVDPPDAAVE
ncbi:MAG TPA: PKD domain-containing protein [Kofleriaceae bacterium]